MQAQMIYPQSNVAAMIAGRLSKSKGFTYGVTKVATGFLVAPVKSGTLAAAVEAFQETIVVAKAEKTWTGEDAVVVDMRFKSVSAEWICALHNDKPFWVAKNSLFGWDAKIVDGQHRIFLKMPTAYAKKRGLLTK